MATETFGGNRVAPLRLDDLGRQTFCVEPYTYLHHRAAAGESVRFAGLRSMTVCCLAVAPGAGVLLRGVDEPLEAGDCVQAEDREVHISVRRGPAQFLVAGTAAAARRPAGLTVTRRADVYRVDKPWGHELWLNGQHPNYALKRIFVKAGTRTSLQYHRDKRETNVLLEGTARLRYKAAETVGNDAVSAADVASVLLEPVSIVDVVPGVLHRLEAVTDIVLYEASTPHLDDVVRIQDDSGRRDGRIDAEHRR